MYPRFEGMMSNLPTKAQDEALLIEKQRELQQSEEQRRSFEALRDDFRNYLSKYNPQALNPHPRPRESSPSARIIQTTPVQPTKPPEPPDSKQSDLISATKGEEEPNPNLPITLTTLPHSPQPPDPPDFKRSRQKSSAKQVSRLKYSCDEIYERMENGLCIFCEEQDTPGHQQLKHKGFRIFMVECDDNQVSDDRELVESVLELPSVVLLPNEETTGSVIGSEAATMETNLLTQLSLYTIGFEAELLCAKELVETDLSIQERESSGVKAMIVTDSIQNEEPSLENDLKATKVSNQVEMSPSPQVPNSDLEQMRNYKLVSHKSWDLEEFKSFDEKMSDKTPYIEDEQDAKYETKEVMKLMSSWSSHVWEPGGALIEHDEWKWLKKNRVIGVQHCSGLDTVPWILLGTYFCEYKKHMRLPVYQFLEVQKILSPGYKRETLKYMSLEISQTVSHVWHRWKSKAEKWQKVLDLMMLSLVSFQSHTKESLREFICGAIIAGKAKYSGDNVAGTTAQSSKLLIQNMEILRRWMYFETATMPLNISESRFMQSEVRRDWHRLPSFYFDVDVQKKNAVPEISLFKDLWLESKEVTNRELFMKNSNRILWSSKSRDMSIIYHINAPEFNNFENVKGLGSLKMLSASYAFIKGAVSFVGILHLANVHELFHSPRPPELFLCEVCRWLSHMTELLLVQVSSIYSSLRTRMFSTGEYCNRLNRYLTRFSNLISGLIVRFSYLSLSSIYM